jgi:hypothetical protein
LRMQFLPSISVPQDSHKIAVHTQFCFQNVANCIRTRMLDIIEKVLNFLK